MLMLLPKPHILSCNFPSFPSNSDARRPVIFSKAIPKVPIQRASVTRLSKNLSPRTYLSFFHSVDFIRKRAPFPICKDSGDVGDSGPVEEEVRMSGDGRDRVNKWTTSALLFAFWAGLIFYVFRLAPDQTPYRDVYFIQKLLFLKGDDGFQMNQVLVALWNIMALWPIIYGMLLLPAGRSSKSKVPVWPFLVLSFLGGAYALIPYFVLWKPPPPDIGEDEIRKWPLNFLESKITAWFVLAAGLSLLTIAGLATGEAWSEFYQYFRESKFIHGMSLDFLLLTSFAPFWVYNDMTARKWVDKGSLLLPLSFIPLLGPALYAVLRPQLADLPTQIFPDSAEKE